MSKFYKYFSLSIAIMWLGLLIAYCFGLFEPEPLTIGVGIAFTSLYFFKEFNDESSI